MPRFALIPRAFSANLEGCRLSWSRRCPRHHLGGVGREFRSLVGVSGQVAVNEEGGEKWGKVKTWLSESQVLSSSVGKDLEIAFLKDVEDATLAGGAQEEKGLSSLHDFQRSGMDKGMVGIFKCECRIAAYPQAQEEAEGADEQECVGPSPGNTSDYSVQPCAISLFTGISDIVNFAFWKDQVSFMSSKISDAYLQTYGRGVYLQCHYFRHDCPEVFEQGDHRLISVVSGLELSVPSPCWHAGVYRVTEELIERGIDPAYTINTLVGFERAKSDIREGEIPGGVYIFKPYVDGPVTSCIEVCALRKGTLICCGPYIRPGSGSDFPTLISSILHKYGAREVDILVDSKDVQLVQLRGEPMRSFSVRRFSRRNIAITGIVVGCTPDQQRSSATRPFKIPYELAYRYYHQLPSGFV